MTSKKFSNIPVTNGTATTTFTPTAEEVGTYNLTAKYIQNDTYRETISIPVNLTINNKKRYTLTSYINPTPVIQSNGSRLYAKLLDSDGNPPESATPINLYKKSVNSTDYTKYTRNTNAEGIASIPLNDTAGNYDYIVEYIDPTDNTTLTSTGTYTIIPKYNFNLTTDPTPLTTDGGRLIFNCTNYDGTPLITNTEQIMLNLGGINYYRDTNTNGEFTININSLQAGTYTYTISYQGIMFQDTLEIVAVSTMQSIDCTTNTAWLDKRSGDPTTFATTVANGYVVTNGGTASSEGRGLMTFCPDLVLQKNMIIHAEIVLHGEGAVFGFRENLDSLTGAYLIVQGTTIIYIIRESSVLNGSESTFREQITTLPDETVIECDWFIDENGAIMYGDSIDNQYSTSGTYTDENLESMMLFFTGVNGYITIQNIQYEYLSSGE